MLKEVATLSKDCKYSQRFTFSPEVTFESILIICVMSIWFWNTLFFTSFVLWCQNIKNILNGVVRDAFVYHPH